MHTIYEISGVKVGCTKNLEVRKNWYPKGTILVVLEEILNATDQEAGDREWYWADKLGYERGRHYANIYAVMASEEERSRFAKESGSKGGKNRDIEQRKEMGRRLGKLMAERTSSEEYSNRGKRGYQNGLGKRTREQRVEWNKVSGRRTAELRKGGCYQRASCPHCGIETIIVLLKRYHLDKCKRRPSFLKRPT